MKLVAIALALTISASADDPYVHPVQPTHRVNGQVRVGNIDPDRVIVPFGDWQYCEGFKTPVPDTVDCTKFTAGHEGYKFRIKAKHSDTGTYAFTITFYRWIDGRTITLNGTVQRNDYTGGSSDKDLSDDDIGYTIVKVYTNAPVSEWVSNTEEYKQQ